MKIKKRIKWIHQILTNLWSFDIVMFQFTAVWKKVWNLMYLWRQQGKPIA